MSSRSVQPISTPSAVFLVLILTEQAKAHTLTIGSAGRVCTLAFEFGAGLGQSWLR